MALDLRLALSVLERGRDEARQLADDWATGHRSYTNLGPNPPYTPDVVAIMDAQEVAKWTTVALGYSGLIRDSRGFYEAEPAIQQNNSYSDKGKQQ